MSQVTSSLSAEQQKKLLSLLGHVRLHLLYKATIHGFAGRFFHNYCNSQGPTVIVAYNAAGFVYGAYTARDYTERNEEVTKRQLSSTASSQTKTKYWRWLVPLDSVCSPITVRPGQILVPWYSWLETNLELRSTQGLATSLREKKCTEMTWHWLSLKCIELKVGHSIQFF